MERSAGIKSHLVWCSKTCCRNCTPKISPYPSFPKRGKLGLLHQENSPFEKGEAVKKSLQKIVDIAI
jgi:hypothetical protein